MNGHLILPAMNYTDWLRRQVARLEDEIRRHSVFESDAPATPSQLKELRAQVVIHRYLKQQLLRRDTQVVVEQEVAVSDQEVDVDTQEFVLVRKP